MCVWLLLLLLLLLLCCVEWCMCGGGGAVGCDKKKRQNPTTTLPTVLCSHTLSHPVVVTLSLSLSLFECIRTPILPLSLSLPPCP